MRKHLIRLLFLSRKLLRCTVAASVSYTVAWQHYNAQRHKPETQADVGEIHRVLFGSLNTSVFTLSLRRDWRVDPHPLSGSFFHCDMCEGEKLKPRHIFQTGIFTSLPFNPVTPIILKNTSSCVRTCVSVCDRSNTSPNRKSVQPTAEFRQPTMKNRQPANQHEAQRWLDRLICDLWGESHKDYWMFAEWKQECISIAALAHNKC